MTTQPYNNNNFPGAADPFAALPASTGLASPDFSSELDRLLTGGTKSFKFANVGDTVQGEIVDISIRQATDFRTRAPLTWDDGNPKQQILITIAAGIIDPAVQDDTGDRTVYIKAWGQNMKAFRLAVQKLGRKPVAGDFMRAVFVGETVNQAGMNPTKNIEYTFAPAQQQAQPAQQAAPVQQAPVQQAQQGQYTAPAPAGQTFPAQPAPQPAQPVQQPAPAQPAPVQQAPVQQAPDPATQARQLIQAGLTDDQIAQATGLTPTQVTQIRNEPPY